MSLFSDQNVLDYKMVIISILQPKDSVTIVDVDILCSQQKIKLKTLLIVALFHQKLCPGTGQILLKCFHDMHNYMSNI